MQTIENNFRTFEMDLGGRKLVIENGKMAKQANGAVLVRYGDTVVLVCATASKEPREGADFFPLTVDFEEKMYAGGKIPGGFIKREGRPQESGILCARLIDRPIRPLFPEGFRNDVQIIATVLSFEQDNAPELAAMIGASCALCVSDIPFNGPIAGVRIGRIDKKFVVNPTAEQRDKSDLNLTVAGSKDAVMMVEAGANELPEEVILDAILFGHEEIKKIVAFQEKIVAEVGKEKFVPVLSKPNEVISAAVKEFAAEKINQAVRNPDKLAREEAIESVKSETVEALLEKFSVEEFPDVEKEIGTAFQKLLKETVRKMISTEKIRPDGRALDEVRPITCEVDLLPRTHGSALFTRGQTQVLTLTTLGPVSDEQVIDGIGPEYTKHYIHHYNFPGFSVGEARPSRSPGRREIGHGALAERALVPMIPDLEVFPYTIRLVSEVLESNGSSSMASVCGSTLSLMAAGVPIKKPVSGVAMGLVSIVDEKNRPTEFSILTDIQGMEDALGDMDFKVAGTRDGVTAIQMDIKVAGITREILSTALEQAKKGREHILGKMLAVISEPRKELSKYAPIVKVVKISVDKIRDLIGSGGKTINKITTDTGVSIDIQEDGTVFVTSKDENSKMDLALQMIDEITHEIKVGEVFTGTVTRLMKFGAFVELLPGHEGLCHISQLSKRRIMNVEDVVKEGDQLMVEVVEIDDKGRINVSHKKFEPDLPPDNNRKFDRNSKKFNR